VTRVEITLVEGDIARQRVDAIVNAANSALLGGGGVDGAIHRRGGPAILAECRALREDSHKRGLPVGEAVATSAGNLAARWVIHTVGPVFAKREDRSPLLRNCYTNSLRLGQSLGAETIAFPLISAGIYGWPVDDAIRQALCALAGAEAPLTEARLVLFGAPTYELAAKVWSELAS
jgi:O-acetyl-ADP-ribose deacetylase